MRGDYAANAGDQRMCEAAHYGGPKSLDLNYLRTFRWPDMSGHTGVVYLGSEITFAHLRDGVGRTYLFGEKYMSAGEYTTGVDHGDDWNLYAGYQDDVCRTAFFPIQRDAGLLGGRRGCCRFGGPHASGWHVAFCDASVRSMSWNLSPRVHKSLANRFDGMVIDDALLH